MEHELRKHIHTVVKETLNTKRPFWKRMKDIFVEILIIVFAVSFAVYMERQREHQHDKAEAHEFLKGLKVDLENDIEEMKSDMAGYQNTISKLKYFLRTDSVNVDTVKSNFWVFSNQTHLVTNQGRYEGFKASGKINTIEDTHLRNKILDLYEERLISLTSSTKNYIAISTQMLGVFYRKWKGKDTPQDNIIEVLHDDEIRNYLRSLAGSKYIIDTYQKAIDDSKEIIMLIDKNYADD